MTLSCAGSTPAASAAMLKRHIDAIVMTKSCGPKVHVKDAFQVEILGIYQSMKFIAAGWNASSAA